MSAAAVAPKDKREGYVQLSFQWRARIYRKVGPDEIVVERVGLQFSDVKNFPNFDLVMRATVEKDAPSKFKVFGLREGKAVTERTSTLSLPIEKIHQFTLDICYGYTTDQPAGWIDKIESKDIVKHPKYVAGKHYVLCIYNVKGQDAVEAAIVLKRKAAAKTPPTIKK